MENLPSILALAISLFSLSVSFWTAHRNAKNADRQLATTYGAAMNNWADRVLSSLQDFLIAADGSIDRQKRFDTAKLAANKLINLHDIGGLLFPDKNDRTLQALESLNRANSATIDKLSERDVMIEELVHIETFRSEFVTAVRSSNGLRQLHRDMTRYLAK